MVEGIKKLSFREQTEANYIDKWADKRIAEGKAKTSQEATDQFKELTESIVGEESRINKAIDKKVKEVLEKDLDPEDKFSIEKLIFDKLRELYEEHPELDRSKQNGDEGERNVILNAEENMTYIFPLKSLSALAKKYESDASRAEFTKLVCDSHIESLRDAVPIILTGHQSENSKYKKLNIEAAKRACVEYQEFTKEMSEIISQLTPENAFDAVEKLSALEKDYNKKIQSNYKFLRHIDYKGERNDNVSRDTIRGWALHVAAHVAGTSTHFDLDDLARNLASEESKLIREISLYGKLHQEEVIDLFNKYESEGKFPGSRDLFFVGITEYPFKDKTRQQVIDEIKIHFERFIKSVQQKA